MREDQQTVRVDIATTANGLGTDAFSKDLECTKPRGLDE